MCRDTALRAGASSERASLALPPPRGCRTRRRRRWRCHRRARHRQSRMTLHPLHDAAFVPVPHLLHPPPRPLRSLLSACPCPSRWTLSLLLLLCPVHVRVRVRLCLLLRIPAAAAAACCPPPSCASCRRLPPRRSCPLWPWSMLVLRRGLLCLCRPPSLEISKCAEGEREMCMGPTILSRAGTALHPSTHALPCPSLPCPAMLCHVLCLCRSPSILRCDLPGGLPPGPFAII